MNMTHRLLVALLAGLLATTAAMDVRAAERGNCTAPPVPSTSVSPTQSSNGDFNVSWTNVHNYYDLQRRTAGGSWGYHVVGTNTTLSALGLPLQTADYSAGVAWRFGPKPAWKVELGWVGRGLWLERGQRAYHGALLSVATALP